MAETDLIQDMWAGLSHMPIMQGAGDDALAAPKYLPADHGRRINAYMVLRAMMDCTTRWYLAEDPANPAKRDEWREWADPPTFCDRIAAGVLGEEQTILVRGADSKVPSEPDLPPPPAPPPTEAEAGVHQLVARLRQQVYDEAVAHWERDSVALFDAWRSARERRPLLLARQEALRAWAEAEELVDKMSENEREHIVPLGSGVYRLGWSPSKARPTVDIFEPDVYFPRLDDATPGDYPTRVDLVWNFLARPPGQEDDPDVKEEEFVRRITYELVPLAEGLDAAAAHGVTLSAPEYHTEADEWREVCLMTDATFPASGFELLDGPNEGARYREELVDPNDPDPETGARFQWDRYPLPYDFVPVVHVPHTPASTTHFGRSPLVRACQLFNEISGADVEEALAARWASRPMVGISGLAGTTADDTVRIAPGLGFRLSSDGGVTKIDMAAGLPALGEYGARLRKQASIVTSVPDGLVGRVDADEVPSGVTLSLSFTPFQQMVLTARLARDRKHSLMLKMVQRIMVQHGYEPLGGDTEIYPASVHLGAFMPQDLSAHASMISLLLGAGAISQQTAIEMLVGLGIPIEDAAAELDRIRAVMADVADQITSATENPLLAARFLGYTDAEAGVGNESAPEGENGGAPTSPPGALLLG